MKLNSITINERGIKGSKASTAAGLAPLCKSTLSLFPWEEVKDMDEREKISKLKELREARQEIEAELQDVKNEYSKLEEELIEELRTSGRESTARYDGIGWVTLIKPRVKASVTSEHQEEMMNYARFMGREDLFKTTIHPQTLNAFVKEVLETGDQLPEFINYHLISQLKLN